MTTLDLGRQKSDSPQQRLLRNAHEAFARELANSLSAFLEAEIGVALETLSVMSAAEFHATLKSPACLISLQLEPRPETAVLSLDCSTVFSLLELLLGGRSGSSSTEARALTEIEWSLLEEVVRVMAAALGEAWKTYHPVEFKVQAFESDPDLVPVPEPGLRLVQVVFSLKFGEAAGHFQIGVPQSFFETEGSPIEKPGIEAGAEEVQRNFALLGDAKVDLEVMLEGPTMKFQELASLSAGQVVQFDFPLEKPLSAVVNGEIALPCHIVTAGRKRAFQVEKLR